MEQYFEEFPVMNTDVIAEPEVAPLLEESVPVMALSRFALLESTYQKLQGRIADNQVLIQQARDTIAQLRQRIRETQQDLHFDESNDENELHQAKVSVQNDHCGTLIAQAEQIREHIYHNSSHAEYLLNPLKQQVAMLELRIQHVRAIEQLLTHIRTGMELEQHQAEIDGVLEMLAQKLAAF